MWKRNLEDMDPEAYIQEFEAKLLKEYEYDEQLEAEREKAMSSMAAIEHLKPNELPLYIHEKVINFKTSYLIHSGSVETIVKPRFRQYMHFQEVLDEGVKGGIFNRRIPIMFKVFPRVTTRKYTNDSSSGYTVHERTPLPKVSVPVTRVNRIHKKRKVIYNRSIKPIPYLRGFRSRSTRTGGKPTYEPFIWASSYESTLFSECVEFGCKPRPFKRCSKIPQKPWVNYWK